MRDENSFNKAKQMFIYTEHALTVHQLIKLVIEYAPVIIDWFGGML